MYSEKTDFNWPHEKEESTCIDVSSGNGSCKFIVF